VSCFKGRSRSIWMARHSPLDESGTSVPASLPCSIGPYLPCSGWRSTTWCKHRGRGERLEQGGGVGGSLAASRRILPGPGRSIDNARSQQDPGIRDPSISSPRGRGAVEIQSLRVMFGLRDRLFGSVAPPRPENRDRSPRRNRDGRTPALVERSDPPGIPNVSCVEGRPS
jgi:hypothetical protein